MSTNDELYQRGLRVIPGGVNSPVRAFRSVGGTPYFVASGSGARVIDVGSTRPELRRRSSATPTRRRRRRAAAGPAPTFRAPTGRVRMAEEIVARVPAGAVRLVSSGTEAFMSAIRLARGVTGRDAS